MHPTARTGGTRVAIATNDAARVPRRSRANSPEVGSKKMYRRALWVVTLLLLGAAGAAARQTSDPAEPAPLAPADEDFLREAALDGLAQMEVNYDALELSRREDVRAFALEAVNLHAPAL